MQAAIHTRIAEKHAREIAKEEEVKRKLANKEMRESAAKMKEAAKHNKQPSFSQHSTYLEIIDVRSAKGGTSFLILRYISIVN